MKIVRIYADTEFPQSITGSGEDDLRISFEDSRIDHSATCENNSCSSALFSISNFHSVTVDGRGASLICGGFIHAFKFEKTELIRVSSLSVVCGCGARSVISASGCGYITLDAISISGAECGAVISDCSGARIEGSVFENLTGRGESSGAAVFYGCAETVTVSKCSFDGVSSNAVSVIPSPEADSPEVELTANSARDIGGQGFRITTRGRLAITENVLRTSGCAVRLAADMQFFGDEDDYTQTAERQRGMNNITIENNHFKNCACSRDTHAVVLRSPVPPLRGLRLHRSLILRDNYFDSFGEVSEDDPALIRGAGILYAVACSDILITGNGFTLGADYPPRGWEIAPIVALACDGIRVADGV
ncbi:MAG: right-handed parallel beta-helix repeat-containing protein [Eubacteriales bacterium]